MVCLSWLSAFLLRLRHMGKKGGNFRVCMETSSRNKGVLLIADSIADTLLCICDPRWIEGYSGRNASTETVLELLPLASTDY
jgi:hypothetical protein